MCMKMHYALMPIKAKSHRQIVYPVVENALYHSKLT